MNILYFCLGALCGIFCTYGVMSFIREERRKHILREWWLDLTYNLRKAIWEDEEGEE